MFIAKIFSFNYPIKLHKEKVDDNLKFKKLKIENKNWKNQSICVSIFCSNITVVPYDGSIALFLVRIDLTAVDNIAEMTI